MSAESPAPTKLALHGFVVVAGPDRLCVRGPWAAYLGLAALYALAMLALAGMVAVGLLDAAAVRVLPPVLAAGLLLYVALWGRWWTFDRRADSVRYVPRRLCAVGDVRGVTVAGRRVRRKTTTHVVYTVNLDLADGSHVRLGGLLSSLWDPAVALELARPIGEWLNVPVREGDLAPAA